MSENINKYIFIDGSVNPQLKLGFGSYLILNNLNTTVHKDMIQTKMFNDTSSSKLEIQTLLYALNEITPKNYNITIFTDCQNILTLQDRRSTLENNNYLTKTNKIVKNHLEYKDFYRLFNMYNLKFVKLKGHKKKSAKDTIDNIFSLVDKSARNSLRNFINSQTVPNTNKKQI